MKKKIVYEGYCEATEIEGLKKGWNEPDIDMANVPNLHRKRYNKGFWTDGRTGKKVRITVEEI